MILLKMISCSVDGKECFRVTTAGPEEVASAVKGSLALVSDMNWGKYLG